MELAEDSKYRLAYLTLRLAIDQKLAETDASAHPAVLEFLDLLAGTQLAAEAAGKRYAAQREKIESFIDAEFGDEILGLVNRAIAELV